MQPEILTYSLIENQGGLLQILGRVKFWRQRGVSLKKFFKVTVNSSYEYLMRWRWGIVDIIFHV